MNKKILVIIISSVVVLTLLSGVVFLGITRADGATYVGSDTVQAIELIPGTAESYASDNNSDYTYIPPTPVEENTEDELVSLDLQEEVPFVPATEMDLDPTSITVFVNKEYDLPRDYKPEKLVTPDVVFNLNTYDERTLMRPEAAVALEKLFNAAKLDGIILYGISGFRSYERQYKIFTNNIVSRGKAYTLRYSAVPGTSEHQTGLAIDVSTKALNYKLSSKFASSPEGIWLEENAHKYGYIIRYPKGNEKITGYAFEPWHIRYLGKELATYLYTNELTLEEYYHYSPSPDFDFEALYADIINYVPPKISGVPIEGEDFIIGENGEIIDVEVDGEVLEDIPVDDEVLEDIPVDGEVPEDIPVEDVSEDGIGEEDGLPDSDSTDAPSDEIPNGQESPTGETDAEDENENFVTQAPDGELPIEEEIITPTPTLTPTPTPVATIAPSNTPS